MRGTADDKFTNYGVVHHPQTILILLYQLLYYH